MTEKQYKAMRERRLRLNARVKSELSKLGPRADDRETVAADMWINGRHRRCWPTRGFLRRVEVIARLRGWDVQVSSDDGTIRFGL